MEVTTITRKLTLDMGHRVPSHASGCRNLHGHTYSVEFSFIADTLALSGAAEGMVADFGHVKGVMMEAIHSLCDHALVLYHGDKLLSSLGVTAYTQEEMEASKQPYMTSYGEDDIRIIIVPFIPTAENLAKFWFEQVQRALNSTQFAKGQGFRPSKIRVWETPNCFAEYQPAVS